MAKKFNADKVVHEPIPKKTSSASNPIKIKWSSMNKHKRRSFKINRGQGK